MKPVDEIAHCTRRLEAVTGGIAKIEKLLAEHPGDAREPGWRQRLAEYHDSVEGLTLRRQLAELNLKRTERAAASQRGE